MTQTEFEKTYTSLRQKLYTLALGFSKASDSELDAEDIVQEAMIAFWELCEKGYPVKNAEALLVKITKNICIGRYRKAQAQKKTGLAQENIISSESAGCRIEEADIKIIKQVLYDSLTRTERRYMLMKVDERMSLDDIADATGKTKSGIKTGLSKAKAKITALMKKLELS